MRFAAALCLGLLAVAGCKQVEDETRPVTSRDCSLENALLLTADTGR